MKASHLPTMIVCIMALGISSSGHARDDDGAAADRRRYEASEKKRKEQEAAAAEAQRKQNQQRLEDIKKAKSEAEAATKANEAAQEFLKQLASKQTELTSAKTEVEKREMLLADAEGKQKKAEAELLAARTEFASKTNAFWIGLASLLLANVVSFTSLILALRTRPLDIKLKTAETDLKELQAQELRARLAAAPAPEGH